MKIRYINFGIYTFLILLYAGIFISIFGYRNFDIHYTDWLMVPHGHVDYGDISINYLNFLAFLNDDIKMPYTDNNAYPFISNMLSIDYCPILMALVKIYYKYIMHVSSVIELQYVWWFGLACWILQGILSYKIIKDSAKTTSLNAIICSIFFVTAPPMIYRFPSNFPLSAHFIILISFLPYFYNFDKRKLILIYFLFVFFVCGIASSFIPIVAINLFSYCIYKAVKDKTIKDNIILASIFILGTLIGTGLWNGNTPDMYSYSCGFKGYNINLNTFFNPINVFRLFKSDLFPFLNNSELYSHMQNEGFAYLGGGFIILLLFSFVLLSFRYRLQDIHDYINKYKIEICVLSAVAVIILFWASALNITISRYFILDIKIPIIIEKILSIFRTPGRIIWNNYYILYFLVMIFIIKNLSQRKATIILAFGLILQIYDIHSTISFLNKEYQTKRAYENPLNNNLLWKTLIANKKVIIIPKIDNTLYYEDYFWDSHEQEYDRVKDKKNFDIDERNYLIGMASDVIYNDFYHYAIYNNIKMNSLIRSRQPKYNGYFLEISYKYSKDDYIYVFSHDDINLLYNLNLNMYCYAVYANNIACIKNRP